MKSTTGFLSKALAFAVTTLALPGLSSAAITVVDPAFAVKTSYTHTTSDDIISFDRDSSSNLYYMTSAGFPDVTVWKSSGGAPSSIYANPSNYAGGSVVTIGNYVYFNDSNAANTQFIRAYGPLSGTPATTQVSSTVNSGLYTHGGELFISGAQSFNGHSQIYRSTLAGDGHLVSDPAVQLGDLTSNSGPLSFDLAGNLYYAPGFSDLSIYKWSQQEVNNAISNPGLNGLSTVGHQWLNYASLYGTVSGASSMLFDPQGNLLVTLTSFGDPSVLAAFGVSAAGTYNGGHATVLTDTRRLGELRSFDGRTFVSSGNQIVEVVPEPGAAWMVSAGLAMLLIVRRRAVGRARECLCVGADSGFLG